ncbi:adenine nucleotide alpha hydrolases-like superfamily protein [Tasmannia lanceolata]|uniref:adenine nucleotide alpha hydrolases-like superfamily protein n=1 Tax=Tasmannia lanceolata TaxID=3420 RepID=UPI004063A732
MLLNSLHLSHALPSLRAVLIPTHSIRFLCKISSCGDAIDMAKYRETFSRRMAMAGIKPHHKIALGVSGGPDSIGICVLASGWKMDAQIGKDESSGFIEGLLGIIVDHGLRSESKDEACHVRDAVSKMGIRSEIACCDWPDGRPKQGHLQEAARDMRYQVFQDVCIRHRIDVLLIAHHADDQAELFILRLSRNSGVLGLAGMAFISQLFPAWIHCSEESSGNHGILLIRPLLEFSKADMYKICLGASQEWVEDPTNQSSLFARNRIRMSLRNLSSTFKYELQAVISACRKTRSFIDQVSRNLISQAVTIMAHGYAIIDLEKLDPSNVNDLCLLKFVTLVLQFISQRHRPVRGSVSKLLLDYIRNFPCKTSLTAAGCYLCSAPQSKGTKLLVCSSLDSPQPSRMDLSFNYTSEDQKYCLPSEIEQIIMEAQLYSDRLVPDASDVPFLHVTSSESVLHEAKKLNLLSEPTLQSIILLQREESQQFNAKTEFTSQHGLRYETKSVSTSLSEPLQYGRSCHFMNRFLVRWKVFEKIMEDIFCRDGSWDSRCNSCVVCHDTTAFIRHMVDADWLYLAKLSNGQTLEECGEKTSSSMEKMEQKEANRIHCSEYVQFSAQRALQALKLIPVSARRGLPVLVDHQDLLLSIPSICFNRCPYLSVHSIFKPKVPLGGGYSSYI